MKDTQTQKWKEFLTNITLMTFPGKYGSQANSITLFSCSEHEQSH